MTPHKLIQIVPATGWWMRCQLNDPNPECTPFSTPIALWGLYDDGDVKLLVSGGGYLEDFSSAEEIFYAPNAVPPDAVDVYPETQITWTKALWKP